jgi:sugar lactone lactonase YvrE
MNLLIQRILTCGLAICSIAPVATGQQYQWTVLAGQPGSPGLMDGVGGGAQFNQLDGIAVDASGNVYVADTYLRKITPAGAVTSFPNKTGGGNSDDFIQFVGTRLTLDNAGNIYMVGNGVRKITPAGSVTPISIKKSSPGDDTVNPSGGIEADKAGNFYVADPRWHVIRKITPAGDITTVAGQLGASGDADGKASDARFNGPRDLALDGQGNIYVADTGNNLIRMITPDGMVRTIAGKARDSGRADGTGEAARFNFPSGVIVDRNGDLYVADQGNSLIRKVTKAGVVTTLAGLPWKSGYADGPAKNALFSSPRDLAMDAHGFLYVTDAASIVRKISPDGMVSTLAGQCSGEGSADGTGSAARFANPRGVALSPTGDLFVADRSNYTIRKITPAGVVTTYAGQVGKRGVKDGPALAAQFAAPMGLAFDRAGTLYVADNELIRKITPAGQVTTLAGSPNVRGNTDGPGGAASFTEVFAIAVGSTGLIYAMDLVPNKGFAIRQITPEGVVTTLPSSGGKTGLARNADFGEGLTVDPKGVLYTTSSTTGGPIGTLYKIVLNGPITLFAELKERDIRNGQTGSLITDATGNIYVGGEINLRKVTPAGGVSVIEANNPKATQGRYPNGFSGASWGVAVSPDGVLYVSFPSNNCILKGVPLK